MKKADWNRRIERASELSEKYASVREVLVFYRQVLDFQRTLWEEISLRPVPTFDRERRFHEQLDTDAASRHLPSLLELVQKKGPSKLAREAAALSRAESEEERRTMLLRFLSGEGDGQAHSFYARVILQPYAQSLAALAGEIKGFAGSVCPVCGGKPQVAVLRPEGDGGKRFLVCSFCLTEWEYRRILCPLCGEEDHTRLPRYSAEEFLAVRVEACDTCKYYLKSVDLTTDGLAVPVEDEIATVPLDGWAVEHGYTKITANLMGF